MSIAIRQVVRRCTPLAIALLLLTAGGLAQAQNSPLTITHTKGTTELAAVPGKVVVFDLASLDTLDTLGVEVTAVPTAKYQGILAKFNDARYERVGSLFEPDYEAIDRIAPDLVVVGGRSSAKYPDLARLAPTIDLTVDPTDMLGSLTRNATTLGRVFGKEAVAEEKLAALNESIAATRKLAAEAGTGLIVLTTGGKMSAYGPGSRFGLIHDLLGVKPAVTDLQQSNHGQAISFEFILEADPDWLFVIDRDAAIGREGQSAQQLLDNELVRQTSAWKNGHVVYLNAANWYLLGSAGLTSMRQNVDQIAEALDRAS